jgi:hypothetical protein
MGPQHLAARKQLHEQSRPRKSGITEPTHRRLGNRSPTVIDVQSATKDVHSRSFGRHKHASQPSRIRLFAFRDIRGFDYKLECLAQLFTHPFV